MTLSIPIHQSITLPDRWQACKTPQELSYWLIAKFETFEADVEAAAAAAAEASHEAQTALAAAQAAAADATQALNAISNLDAQVVQLSARVTSLAADITAAEGNITALTARMVTTEADIDSLESRVGQTEFDIGQAQTDINAVGTIAQNNQREIGTDETAGTIKGRLTELENGGISGKKLIRHMVRIRFSNCPFSTTDALAHGADIQGKASGVVYVNIFNDSDAKLQTFQTLAAAIPADGGVQATGYLLFDNSDSALVTGWPEMYYKAIAVRVRSYETNKLRIDCAFENKVQYDQSDAPALPIDYCNNAAKNVDIVMLDISAAAGTADFYDVREELPAVITGGSAPVTETKYQHNIAFCHQADGATFITGAEFSYIDNDPTPRTINTLPSGKFYGFFYMANKQSTEILDYRQIARTGELSWSGTTGQITIYAPGTHTQTLRKSYCRAYYGMSVDNVVEIG